MKLICISDKKKYQNRVLNVKTTDEFYEKVGFHPSMRKGEKCRCDQPKCLCMIDPFTTAENNNVKLDIGDKQDVHKYWFVIDEDYVECNQQDIDFQTRNWKYKYQRNDDRSNSMNPNNNAYN
jgi:hypothetical protein